MHEQLKYLCRSIAFLSRIPMPNAAFEGDDGKFESTSGMFALAGVLIAIGPALIATLLLYSGANASLVSIITVILLVMITGALHEDGLSDAVDGLWSGRSQDRILEIMHDSRLGAFGAIALILTLMLKTAAIYQLALHLTPIGFFATIIATAGISRAMMIYHWHHIPPARKDGVAAKVGQPNNLACYNNLLVAAFLIMMLFIAGNGLISSIFAICIMALGVSFFTKHVGKKINGHTGDTIGATQQLSELILLTTLSLWLS